MTEFVLEREVPSFAHRAELVSQWYLRFNGYFPLTKFILHDAGAKKQPGGQLTDADILALRLPHTEEVIEGPVTIRVATDPHLDVREGLTDFIIAEVSSKECKSNWINEEDPRVNVEYLRDCLRRFGYWDRETVDCVAKQLSERKLVLSSSPMPIRVRLLAFGVSKTDKLPGFQQVTFESAFDYMKGPLWGCYAPTPTDVTERIVSDHKQWHPLIREVYRRLRGHKVEERSPREIVAWLFPDASKRQQ